MPPTARRRVGAKCFPTRYAIIGPINGNTIVISNMLIKKMGDVTVCYYCRGTSFVYEERLWDRICLDCGSTSAYELPDTKLDPYQRVRTYSRKTYFSVVMNRAIGCGTKIDHGDIEWLEAKFVLLVKRFNEIKVECGFKSFPSYVVIFNNLCAIRGIRVVGLKLPKLKQTLARVDGMWCKIKSVVEEWRPECYDYYEPLDLADCNFVEDECSF